MAEPEQFSIDEYTTFEGVLLISGWARDPRGISSVILDLRNERGEGETVLNIRNDDGTTRWRQTVELPKRPYLMTARLRIAYSDGSTGTIRGLGFPRDDRTIKLPLVFEEMLPGRGVMLEIGSLAQSDVYYISNVPRDWEYVGLDVVEGPNVNVVGDAHELSKVFPFRRFDAFRATSVFEHLAMPWAVAVELNQVLNVGAIGLIQSCQSWPAYTTSADYFRFSEQSWAALFNRGTGFEIVEAAMGLPTYMVPKRIYELTDIHADQVGYLASSVIVRKIKNTALRWDVRVADLVTSTR